jgi:TRAP-type C4-dicarboxylate transport system permease large subunit
VILPFLIPAAVINGIATAMEVATIGIVYTVMFRMFFTGNFHGATSIPGWSRLHRRVLSQSGFSSDLADLMMKTPSGKAGFLIVSIILLAVLGSVVEGFPAVVLFAPLLFQSREILAFMKFTIRWSSFSQCRFGFFRHLWG